MKVSELTASSENVGESSLKRRAEQQARRSRQGNELGEFRKEFCRMQGGRKLVTLRGAWKIGFRRRG